MHAVVGRASQGLRSQQEQHRSHLPVGVARNYFTLAAQSQDMLK